MASESILGIQKLHVQFDSRVIFKDLDWSAQRGEFVGLLGPSGSGKSTLLRVFAGLQPPTSGSLEWSFSEGTTKARPAVGFVFQEPQLLPWRNVLENTLLPLELQPSLSNLNAEEQAVSALTQVGLKEVLGLYPHQLSGGMKMRVSIARALVVNPKVLFMDEPFAALDEAARFRLQMEIRALAEKKGLTVFFVTHSIYEAAFLSDRIVVLQPKGPVGSALSLDEPVRYSCPRNEALRAHAEYQAWVLRLSQKMQEAP
jgi:NitT/TauT family transport system ATP-binding protein